MNRVTGWLSPKGDFIPCKNFNHLEVAERPDVREAIPRLDKIMSELDGIRRGCEDLAHREGACHAEWHVYEIALDEYSVTIWKTLLNHGYIRVGEIDEELHFEGRPNHLKNKYQKCVDFADSYGAKAIFEPQKG